MSRFEWWRSHHGAPTDPKWLVIAKRAGVAPGVVAAIAWALLDHASQSDDRGLVADFDPETYAAYSGFEEAQIIAVIEAMGAKGVIVEGRIAKWEKRQPKREDDSTERTRRYRERQSENVPEKPAAAVPISAQNSVTDQGEEPLIRKQAFDLDAEIKVALGFGDPLDIPAGYAGSVMRVEAWLAKGWQRNTIIESIRAQMSRREATGPPGSIKYFERGIAEAHAMAKAPLPEHIPKQSSRHGNTKSAFAAAGERLFADLKGGSSARGAVSDQLLQDRRGERS